MLRRAVFSDVQRKALEKMFQKQKYISKPDRKKLAAKLGLKDSQVRASSPQVVPVSCEGLLTPLGPIVQNEKLNPREGGDAWASIFEASLCQAHPACVSEGGGSGVGSRGTESSNKERGGILQPQPHSNRSPCTHWWLLHCPPYPGAAGENLVPESTHEVAKFQRA